mmetsp:Transcript_40026/g.105932  ORF Transcript_40026/g.105932 Transcript_40026/m.105932 type:complete len:472 (+) Transcript_40026:289-1704(+)
MDVHPPAGDQARHRRGAHRQPQTGFERRLEGLWQPRVRQKGWPVCSAVGGADAHGSSGAEAARGVVGREPHLPRRDPRKRSELHAARRRGPGRRDQLLRDGDQRDVRPVRREDRQHLRGRGVRRDARGGLSLVHGGRRVRAVARGLLQDRRSDDRAQPETRRTPERRRVPASSRNQGGPGRVCAGASRTLHAGADVREAVVAACGAVSRCRQVPPVRLPPGGVRRAPRVPGAANAVCGALREARRSTGAAQSRGQEVAARERRQGRHDGVRARRIHGQLGVLQRRGALLRHAAEARRRRQPATRGRVSRLAPASRRGDGLAWPRAAVGSEIRVAKLRSVVVARARRHPQRLPAASARRSGGWLRERRERDHRAVADRRREDVRSPGRRRDPQRSHHRAPHESRRCRNIDVASLRSLRASEHGAADRGLSQAAVVPVHVPCVLCAGGSAADRADVPAPVDLRRCCFALGASR